MKIATLTLLPLLVASATVPAERRDDSILAHGLSKRDFWDSMGGYLSNNLSPVIQWTATQISWLLKWQESPVKFRTMTPEIDQKALKTTLTYGPFYLKGTKETEGKEKIQIQMDPKSTIFIRTLKGLPWNAAILSARPTLTFEDGKPADFAAGVYVHHFLVADLSKPSAPFAMCPNMHKEETLKDWAIGYVMEQIGAGLIQVGNDAYGGPNIFLPQKGNLKSAFLTNKDDMFGMQAEIVNYNEYNRSVFLNMELEYLEDKPKNFLDASTIVLSATGCRDPGYRPPPGAKQYNHTSEVFDITQNGYIVNARGHLHDGGTAIELWLNNKMVCRSLPEYGRVPGSGPEIPETIVSMSWCHDSVPIKKGDKLLVKTYYDVEVHPLRQEAGKGEKKEDGKGAKDAKGGKEMEGGHAHGGHGGHGAAGGAEMEGMEEMGIMTTNFAWDLTSKDALDAKAAKEAKDIKTAKDAKDGKVAAPNAAGSTAKDSKDTSGSWWSSLFGSSNTTEAVSPTKTETVPAKPTAAQPANTQTWSEYFSSWFGGSSKPAEAAKPSLSLVASAAPAPAAPKPAASAAPAAPAPAAPKPMENMPSGHSHGH